jgi:drug/metabolite transporter (DMT)-like permease
MANWSLGSILQRRIKLRENPIVAGAIHQLAAGLVFLPLALIVPQHEIAWSVRGVSALLYLVVFGSIVGYTSYAYALSTLPVAVVSLHTYVNSVVAVLLGWLVYREQFGFREAAAMAIIFTGVAVVKRTARG